MILHPGFCLGKNLVGTVFRTLSPRPLLLSTTHIAPPKSQEQAPQEQWSEPKPCTLCKSGWASVETSKGSSGGPDTVVRACLQALVLRLSQYAGFRESPGSVPGVAGSLRRGALPACSSWGSLEPSIVAFFPQPWQSSQAKGTWPQPSSSPCPPSS